MTSIAFEPSEYYTGPAITDALIARAEEVLGYRLPGSYLDLLRVQNGGRPTRRCFRTPFPTSWATNHIEIDGIRGIGGSWGIDTKGPTSSPRMIQEWGYPRIGIVICDMPSGGHDAVMLDYSVPGLEPAVCYVDEDHVPRVIAATFAEFVAGLVTCDDVRNG